MSLYGSKQRLNTLGQRSGSKTDLTGLRGDMMGGNGFPVDMLPMDGAYRYHATSSRSTHGGARGQIKVVSGGGELGLQNKVYQLNHYCQDCLEKAAGILSSGGPTQKADFYLDMARDHIEELHLLSQEIQDPRMSQDIFRLTEKFHLQLSSLVQKAPVRKAVSDNEGERLFKIAMNWINQQKATIESFQFNDDEKAASNDIIAHNMFEASIQRNANVENALRELNRNNDKYNANILEQEMKSLQKLSNDHMKNLESFQKIIREISDAIMWVNEREEEELVFDWGDKNIDSYIPIKQEKYSKLMTELEIKEKDLNKLKSSVEHLLHTQHHPATEKIEAYMDTLQTQWWWLLHITRCIEVHLKENAAYSQFFKEANEINASLQKEKERITKMFVCDKNTSLESLQELLKDLEREKVKILENKRHVQSLVSKSKSIVRLKPRYPDYRRGSENVMVQALCDFKQEQKVIKKGDEAILKSNQERSKWTVIGPGGLEMEIPSVCLLIPPPNPLSVSLASKNEQFYESIMGIWNQLFINIKSLITWQYCLQDISYINSLTLTMLSKMPPEEYRNIISRLEARYAEFLRTSQNSQMFGEEDKQAIQNNVDKAQQHYDALIVQLPHVKGQEVEKTTATKQENKAPVKQPSQPSSVVSLLTLSNLQELHKKLEMAESGLTSHLHVHLGENSVHQCSVQIQKLQGVHQDLELIQNEYLRIREAITKQLKDVPADSEQAKYLHSELEIINQKRRDLQGLYSVYIQRLSALKALLQSILQAEDIIKVHEARLTEKETSSLDPQELENHRSMLWQMKSELEQKRDLLTSMESNLESAVQWNGQISDSFHRCDVDLSKYSELVNQLCDRWRRIQTQIDSRMWDLEKQKNQITEYQHNKTSTEQWIDNARKRQNTLQTVKLNDIQAVTDHMNQQKALYNEIKNRREKVDDVVKNADSCAGSIKNYEMQLASYSSGLETLLNVPIKRTLLHSPGSVVRQEAAEIQAHYIELLTRSSDYSKFLNDMLKNMEELKIRNARIEMLEDELSRLKDGLKDQNMKNKSLEDSLSHYKFELSQSKNELEQVEKTTVLQLNATKVSKDGQIQELSEQLTRLQYQLEDEKRKRRIAEERYTSQQEEYEATVRRRQKELEEVNWMKIDLEKSVKDKELIIERLKIQLDEEEKRRREAESDISKVRTQCTQEIKQLKQTYETEIHVTKTTVLKASQQKEEDTAELRHQVQRLAAEKRDLEDELRRLRQSVAHTEAQKSKAEQEISQQRASVVQETRIRTELEVQLRKFMQEREDDGLKLKEANRSIQEKTREISVLTFNLEEEGKKRRALELELNRLKQAEAELKAKNVSYIEAINKLKLIEQEIHITRVELEKQTSEKTKTEQNCARLQSRIRELQGSLERLEAELEKQKNATQEEFTRRKRMEAELERMTRACKEHTTTINSLKSIQIEVTNSGRKYEQEIKALQEALDKSLRDHKVTKEELAAVREELKAVKQKLQQEQVRSHELNQRNESLYKTIEEKSRQLNDKTTEIEKLKTLTQNLTKERLRLEEELRAVRQERDELKSNQDKVDGESASQIYALHAQLQSSTERTSELQTLINDLTKEREKLKTEIDKFQKQSIETSMKVHESQSKMSDLLRERDSLMSRLRLLEQEESRVQRLEEELARFKLLLETEIRNKNRLEEEKNSIYKEYNSMKSQYELKSNQIRQRESDIEKTDRERQSLRSEIERLMRELKSVEERYKCRLLSSEREVSELALKRDALEREIERLKQRPFSSNRQTQTDEKATKIVSETTMTVKGIRNEVSVSELFDSKLLDETDLQRFNRGELTSRDIEDRLKSYLFGSTCIAGIYDEANDRIMSFYLAMKEGLLMRGTTLELLEAQASSGFIVDPVNNVFLTVEEATKRGLIGKEFKNKLLSAEKAVIGYKDPATGKTISLFQAIEKGIIERGHGIRLLEAQIASGGIIDPIKSHRINVSVAYERGYFDEEMNEILSYDGDDTKGFFDPNTQDNLTYLQLKERCITDPKTGLILLPLKDKKNAKKSEESRSNVLRKRRVVIVDPDTGLEMSVREAYHKDLIDYETFLDLSEQECEWEEITITASDGTSRLVIVDRKTGTQYDVQDSINSGIIEQKTLDEYRGGKLTLTQLADQISSRTKSTEMNIAASTVDDMVTCSSPTQASPSSPTVRKRFNSISITVSPPGMFDDQSPVAAIFDTETLEKITVLEGVRRGIVDTITAQRLLEAQASTGGIINPATGDRLSLDDAVHQSIIDQSMATKLKAAQKAYIGFEDLKTRRKLSAAEAVKETWLPYEAGQRFLEFQYVTGGLVDPGTGYRITMEEAIRKGWVDGKGAQKLQDSRTHQKNLTCPKTKLKISYKEAMDSCMVEETNGMKLLQASSISSKGISSPYNVSNPGSRSGSRAGSRTGSRSGSRRGSVDYSSSTFIYNFSSSSTTMS